MSTPDWRSLPQRNAYIPTEQLAELLTDATADLPTTPEQRATLAWLAGWETQTVVSVLELLELARQAGPR